MASVAGTSPFADRRSVERRRLAYPPVQDTLLGADGLRVSWGGIWGGVLSATGLLMLLTALGVAIGISAVNPSSTDVQSLGTGAGIYAAVSLLLALFVGGMVSTRIGAIFDSTTGFFEGALVWVVSVLLIGYLAGSGIGAVAGGAFKMIGGATQAIGTVMQSSGASGGVDVSGSVDQIVARLKDPNTAQQISKATGMPVSEVQASLGETAQRVENSRSNPGQAAQEAKQGLSDLAAKSKGALQQKAEEAKPAATKAAWITFGALVLSLLAAVIGAMLGRRHPTSMGT